MSKCRICERDNPSGSERCQSCGAWLEQAVSTTADETSSDSAPQPGDFEEQIASLVRQGQKIAAIKLYREQTGSGLAEAKSAVEALAAGQTVVRRSPADDGITPESLEGQVLDLMRGQKKIEAIKLYRQQTGVGLKEAKDAVESLAAKYGIQAKGAGCAGMALLLLIVSVIVGLSMWALAC